MDKFLIKQPRSTSDPSVNSPVALEIQRDTIPPPPLNVDWILEVGTLKRNLK